MSEPQPKSKEPEPDRLRDPRDPKDGVAELEPKELETPEDPEPEPEPKCKPQEPEEHTDPKKLIPRSVEPPEPPYPAFPSNKMEDKLFVDPKKLEPHRLGRYQISR